MLSLFIQPEGEGHMAWYSSGDTEMSVNGVRRLHARFDEAGVQVVLLYETEITKRRCWCRQCGFLVLMAAHVLARYEGRENSADWTRKHLDHHIMGHPFCIIEHNHRSLV